MAIVTQTEHPHIVRAAHRRGEPIIAATGITVRAVVELMQIYNDAGRVQEALPDLSLAEIYDALAFYHDHREEIDTWIERNAEKAHWLMLGRGKTLQDAGRLIARVRDARSRGWRPPDPPDQTSEERGQ